MSRASRVILPSTATIVRRMGRFAFVLLVGWAAWGCAATSDYMRLATTPGVPPPRPDSARVVFIRPSGYGASITTTILDGNGRFLGDSLPESYFAVDVPPGSHLFIAWAENTSALQAQLAAGRTYYVEVAPKLGVLSVRVQLLAITPRSESWSELGDWLRESDLYLVDEPAGQAYLRERSEDTRERIRRGKQILTEYDADELAERTLRPEDGR